MYKYEVIHVDLKRINVSVGIDFLQTGIYHESLSVIWVAGCIGMKYASIKVCT